MPRDWRSISMLLTRFRTCYAGGVAVMFAVAAPVAVSTILVAVELSQLTNGQSKLQAIADSAAIAAARELRLGNSTEATILSVAKSIVDSHAGSMKSPISFAGKMGADKKSVSVNLNSVTNPSLAKALGLAPTQFVANANAKVLGGAPVCLIALEKTIDKAIDLEKNAKMNANACAVFSNSKGQESISAKENATITAAMICSAGGKSGGVANYQPSPTTDCPPIPDPLANRPHPPVGACIKNKLVVSGGTMTLTPGTYCNGLTITDAAEVSMQPGVYVIKDGELMVSNGASIKGTDVGFYFTGKKATLNFQKATTISLTAPKTGPMAGILFFQNTNVSGNPKYEISSDNASMLLGTIYLPTGRFYSEGSKPIAQKSAYTILIAKKVHLSAGPTMTLNSNYNATDVPVPEGLGPNSNKITLEN